MAHGDLRTLATSQYGQFPVLKRPPNKTPRPKWDLRLLSSSPPSLHKSTSAGVKVRQSAADRHRRSHRPPKKEYLLRIFQIKQIPFNAYDMASDEQARRLWKRKVPVAKQTLPGLLVDNTFVGTVDEFEAAVEQGDAAVRKFLRMDDEYNADADRFWATPAPDVVPIGVPGVQRPSEITGHKTVFHGPKDKPIDRSKIVKHDAKLAEGEIDLTETLGGFGLEGVTITEDELAELVAGLGLEEKQADALVKGITEASAIANPPSPPPPEPTKPTITTTTTTSPTRPTVKVDISAALPPPASIQVASPALLTPATALLASHEVMSELAKRVEAKRRSRTDAKPRRIPSISPLSTPILETPVPEDEASTATSSIPLPTSTEEETKETPSTPIKKRERKPSQIESAKPKVAFPLTPGGEDPPELPAEAEPTTAAAVPPPSPSPARSRKTSAMASASASTPQKPPSSFPSSPRVEDSKIPTPSAPVRERKRSAAFGATRPKLPGAQSSSSSSSVKTAVPSVPPLPKKDSSK